MSLHIPPMTLTRKIDKARGARIKRVRLDILGYKSQEQFAQWIGGVSRGAVGNWELGKDVGLDNLKAIASKAGVSLDWLAYGAGDAPDRTFRKAEAAQMPEPDLVRIPDLAIFGGMGGGGELDVYTDADSGQIIDPEQVRGYWSLPDYMVRGLGQLQHIYAWEVRGDSMEPTIPGGSVVFVDTKQNQLPPDDIYAINYGDGLMVKRLKLVPRSEMVSVISDNERYGADDLPRTEVHVWGRIVGWFQWRG